MGLAAEEPFRGFCGVKGRCAESLRYGAFIGQTRSLVTITGKKEDLMEHPGMVVVVVVVVVVVAAA